MVKPIRNKILFKPFLIDEKTESGLIVPDSFRGESDKGIIVSVGNGTKIKPMKLKEGSIAYRVHGWGEPIYDNGGKYYIMEDSAVIAVEEIEYSFGKEIKMEVRDRYIKTFETNK